MGLTGVLVTMTDVGSGAAKCQKAEGGGRREEGDGWECRYLIISLYNVM